MKISPINHQQTFKGLWGKTTFDSGYDSVYSWDDVISEYHPFKNEKKSAIDEIVKKHSVYKQDMADPAVISNPVVQVYNRKVEVKERLPFSSKDFVDYTMNRLSKAKSEIVEQYVKKYGLTILKK